MYYGGRYLERQASHICIDDQCPRLLTALRHKEPACCSCTIVGIVSGCTSTLNEIFRLVLLKQNAISVLSRLVSSNSKTMSPSIIAVMTQFSFVLLSVKCWKTFAMSFSFQFKSGKSHIYPFDYLRVHDLCPTRLPSFSAWGTSSLQKLAKLH